MKTKGPKLKPINSWNDVPDFESEAEEQEFWSRHSLGPALLEQMKPAHRGEGSILPPARSQESYSASVQLDRDLSGRLKALARKKGKAYQTLLREFVIERLYEEEKREGIIR